MIPGEVVYAGRSIACNEGQETVVLSVENTSPYPVYVTSHYHFFEVNKRLSFDRCAAYGRRLDVPSGSGVRWEPGQVVEVRLVDYGGSRRVYGYQGFCERRPFGIASWRGRGPRAGPELSRHG